MSASTPGFSSRIVPRFIERTGGSLKILRDVSFGVVVGFLVWVLLEGSQAQWWQAMSKLPVSGLAVPSLVLVVAGTLLAALALLPVSPWTTGVAAAFIALLTAPVAAGTGFSWWPEAWPGSPLRLGAFSGTYLAIGVLITVTVGRALGGRSVVASLGDSDPAQPAELTPPRNQV
jgi:hypothetical protein